jgi:hypothetical protein
MNSDNPNNPTSVSSTTPDKEPSAAPEKETPVSTKAPATPPAVAEEPVGKVVQQLAAPEEESPATRPGRKSSQGFAKKEDEEAEEVFIPTPILLDDLNIEEREYRDYPNILPHGFFLNGQRLRNFKVNEFSAELDSRLGKLYSGQRVAVQQVLSMSFPHVIAEVEGMTLNELAAESGCTVAQLIEQMPLADALTMVLGVREALVGEELAIADRCPNCKTHALDNPEEGREYHNISDIKAGMIDELEQRLVVQLDLEKGFTLHGQLCKRIEMRPVRLYELARMPNMERGRLDVSMAQLMICGIPECDRVKNVKGTLFSDVAYNSLSGTAGLRDRNKILAASEALQKLGPSMNLPNVCDNCGEKWDSQVGWVDLRSFWFKPAAPQTR